MQQSLLSGFDSQKKSSFNGDALSFILPLLGLIKIELVGELFVHEIVLILIFPLLILKRGSLLTQGMAKVIFLFGLLWLGSQIVSDTYQMTSTNDMMRGWAKITFFLISFGSLVLLMSNPFRVFLWIAASIVPTFVRPFQLFAHDLDPLVLWKFGIGTAILSTACLPSLWKFFKKPTDITSVRRIAWLYILFGFGSFFLNARSMAGISILTGILLFIFINYRGIKLRTQALALGLAISLALVFALISVYSAGASSGFFGIEAQSKYEMQNAVGGGPVAVMMGGRSERGSTAATAQSIIGRPSRGCSTLGRSDFMRVP